MKVHLNRLLVSYLALTALWIVLLSIALLGWFGASSLASLFSLSCSIALVVIFFQLTRSFLSHEGKALEWWAMGAVWMVGFLAVDGTLLAVAGDGSIRRQAASVIVFTSGWSVFISGMLLLIVQGYRSADHPTWRKQIKRWLAAFVLTAVGGVALIASIFSPGVLIASLVLHIAAGLVITWTIISPNFNRRSHDFFRIVRQYSQSIGSILNPELLATVAIGLISEALEIKHGYLFLVETDILENGSSAYMLKGTGGMGGEKLVPAYISTENPVAKYMTEGHTCLVQSDIDRQLRFQSMPADERRFFSSLNTAIYIPICIKDGWIGLLALGPKASAGAYSEQDVLLLNILADQTAVAIQNARLVESLTRLNNDFKRAYSALERANTQLEKLDRTKSDFISISSHELRTPLSVIRGYSEILKEEPPIIQNAYYNKLVTGIHTGILRLHEIVDSMLDMASIDTRSLQLQTEQVSINVLLRMICESNKKIFSERKLNLQVDDMRQLPSIEADPEALRKVFNQLVSNAIKFTPDGGSITISGQAVEPGSRNMPDGGVEVIVADNGIGIATEIQDLIFNKFYQTGRLDTHSTGKTKFKGAGSGLGLSIAKGIVEAHGGKIVVESPGYDETKCPGSKFHVFLPVKL